MSARVVALKVKLLLALICLMMTVPGGVLAQTLTIAAAQSLKVPLRGILPLFEAAHPGVDVRVVYGPSQTLREQIADGAPADVFLPASAEETDALYKKGLTLNGGPHVYAQTSLVLATASAAHAKVVSFANIHSNVVSRIAVGDPNTTSLGKLTKEVLSQLDLGPAPPSRYLYGKHDEVINLVKSGEADVGVMYRVDVAANPKLQIIDRVPVGIRSPVLFAGAVVWTCGHASCSLAREFLTFLESPPSQAMLQKHGFEPVSEGNAIHAKKVK
jgi:molybdate transport system substrate-binding protein